MEEITHNQSSLRRPQEYLTEQINILRSILSYALDTDVEKIKINFPTLENFYYVNNVYKSSWAVYIQTEKLPKLLYTGNFLVQGAHYGKRSSKSPFGAKALSVLTSLANTFSYEASLFKQNWTLDLNLFEDNNEKLRLSVKEYQEFLKLLNTTRAQWLLHLSEEGSFDFVISEFSEPVDQLFFMNLEDYDILATKIKTFFKPISQTAIELFQKLSSGTEFEGKFYNLQPGMWLRDDVLIEMEKFHSEKFFNGETLQLQVEVPETTYNNPFKVQAFKPTY